MVQKDWQTALAALLAEWQAVSRDQRAALVDQVVEHVDAGQLHQLALLAVDSAAGATLLAGAMTDLAGTAAARVVEEAATQGVSIDHAAVKIDGGRLAGLAQARAAMAGSYMAQQAGARALQITQVQPPVHAAADDGLSATMKLAMAVGDDITVWLGQLSDQPLTDQLGAALTAAQNAGRIAALAEAPADDAAFTASEVLDQNTCAPCKAIDGTEFLTLDDAAQAYANGGYIGCLGGLRCRGTVISTWGLNG